MVDCMIKYGSVSLSKSPICQFIHNVFFGARILEDLCNGKHSTFGLLQICNSKSNVISNWLHLIDTFYRHLVAIVEICCTMVAPYCLMHQNGTTNSSVHHGCTIMLDEPELYKICYSRHHNGTKFLVKSMPWLLDKVNATYSTSTPQWTAGWCECSVYSAIYLMQCCRCCRCWLWAR